MAQNTHYHVLQDGPVTLSTTGAEQTILWNPSNDIILNNLQLSPVLSFRADPTGNSSATLSVRMRNQNQTSTDVINYSFSGGAAQTVFEVLDRTRITDNNMAFIFEKTGGDNNLSISDVIVWFHRDV